MTVLNKEYFVIVARSKAEKSHKDKLTENFRPIARMGVELELQENKTAVYWNDSSFTLVEDFKAWNLVVSSNSMSAGSLALLIAMKLKYDVITLEGEGVRVDFTPTQRMIVDVPRELLFQGLGEYDALMKETKLQSYQLTCTEGRKPREVVKRKPYKVIMKYEKSEVIGC